MLSKHLVVTALTCLAWSSHAHRSKPFLYDPKSNEANALARLSLAFHPARSQKSRQTRNVRGIRSHRPSVMAQERRKESLQRHDRFAATIDRRDILRAAIGGAGLVQSALVQPAVAAVDFSDLPYQNFNTELLDNIENMREEHDRMGVKILNEQAEHAKLEKLIASRTNRLRRIEGLISQSSKLRNELDTSITDAETELSQILGSESALLDKLKKKYA